MIICSKLFPKISTLLNFSKKNYISNYLNLTFFKLGRDALLNGLISLGLKKGDHILVPAYICDSTIEPLRLYGFKIIFIDINKNLGLSLEAAEKYIGKNEKIIKAIIIVNYFGFKQDNKEIIGLCKNMNIFIVEDSSHSFFSTEIYDHDPKFDLTIFSFRKTLPVNDGGALKIYEYKEINKPLGFSCSSFFSQILYFLLRIFELFFTRLGVNIYSKKFAKIKNKYLTRDAEPSTVNLKNCLPSFQLKQYLADQSYLTGLKEDTRNNFVILDSKLKELGIKSLFKLIDKKIVPQAYIFFDESQRAVEFLRDNGTGAWKWPDSEIPHVVRNNKEDYPIANLYNEKLALIPVHRNIGRNQIEHIFSLLKKLGEDH